MTTTGRLAIEKPCPESCRPYVERTKRCPDCTGDTDVPIGVMWDVTDVPAISVEAVIEIIDVGYPISLASADFQTGWNSAYAAVRAAILAAVEGANQ